MAINWQEVVLSPPSGAQDTQNFTLKRDLLSDVAERCAYEVAERSGNNKSKPTQLRRFYDELCMWHERVFRENSSDDRAEKFREFDPFIQMMIAKAAYAKSREHIDDSFFNLFKRVITQIGDPASLKNAKLFMEAFMGFYKGYKK